MQELAALRWHDQASRSFHVHGASESEQTATSRACHTAPTFSALPYRGDEAKRCIIPVRAGDSANPPCAAPCPTRRLTRRAQRILPLLPTLDEGTLRENPVQGGTSSWPLLTDARSASPLAAQSRSLVTVLVGCAADRLFRSFRLQPVSSTWVGISRPPGGPHTRAPERVGLPVSDSSLGPDSHVTPSSRYENQVSATCRMLSAPSVSVRRAESKANLFDVTAQPRGRRLS